MHQPVRIAALASFTLAGCQSSLQGEVTDLQEEVWGDDFDDASLESRIDALELAVSTSGSTITTLQDNLATMQGNLDNAANVSAALQTRLQAAEDRIDELEEDLLNATVDIETASGRWIEEDITLTVGTGQEFATLLDALDYLNGARVVAPYTATIEIASGTYSHSEPIVLDHPDGARITLVGMGVGPANTVLSFNGTSSGLLIQGGGVGLIENLQVFQNGTATDTYGIRVDHAQVGVKNVEITEFAAGLQVLNGADAWTAGNGVRSFNNSGSGVLVDNSATLRGPATSENNVSNGFVVSRGSLLAGGPLVADLNNEVGISASSGSVVFAASGQTTLSDNNLYGVVANGAWVSIPGASITGDASDGAGMSLGERAYLNFENGAISGIPQFSANVVHGSTLRTEGATMPGAVHADGQALLPAKTLGYRIQ